MQLFNLIFNKEKRHRYKKREKANFRSLLFCISLIGLIFSLFIATACKNDLKKEKKVNTSSFERDLPRPAWVSQEPLVFVGGWDDMPIFRRRRGGNTLWQEEDYLKTHKEETVLKLKDLGVTMAIIHFYKGFGLKAEKEHMEDAKKLALLLRKNGIRVGVYIGFDVAYETFLLEKPNATDWFVPDYLENPVRCPFDPKQTFRQQIYCMHPGYIKYMKRILKMAVKDFKVDLIHFDNAAYQAGQRAFQHPLAVDDFRKFLKNKYSPDLLTKRLGFNDVKFVEPPKYNQAISTIDDPLFQEWTDFRCQQLANYYNIMENYIRKLNPEVAVENNPSGLTGVNSKWEYGVDHPRLLSHLDFFWSEEGNEAGISDEGVLVSKIRSYKMASTLANRVFTYTSRSELLMAESMAYNRQVGMVGGLLAAEGLPEKQRDYIKFFHNNFNYYHKINNVADIAVLLSYSTMAFNNDRPYQSTFLFEQALIQAKIPFDIIFDDNLKDLSKYKVLVLADQECLSDENLDLIRNFVEQGGGLVATEHTSLYNEWRQRKKEFGLNDLFQISAPEWNGTRIPEDILSIPVQKRELSKGKIVYIPEVIPSIPKPPAVAMISRYWKLPINWKELVESVRWTSSNDLAVDIEAPPTVTIELMQKEDNSALILHMLNFDSKNKTSPVKNIIVDIKAIKGKKVRNITIMTPDGRSDENLQFMENGDRIKFVVPQLYVYNLVVMKFE